MKSLEEYQEAGKEIYDSLRLYTYPIAIKFIKSESEIPKNVMRPSKNNEIMTLCQAFTWARRWKTNVAMTRKDNACITSSCILKWYDDDEVEPEEVAKATTRSKYRIDAEAELRVRELWRRYIEKDVDKIKDHIGFIVSPLTETIVIPDTILIYGDPNQIIHIIHSLTYEGKILIESYFAGYSETCNKGALLPYITGGPQVVLPGQGDRRLSFTTENEMAIGIPGELVFKANEHMFKSGGKRNNMGQPNKFVMQGLPKSYSPPAWKHLRRVVKRNKKLNKIKEKDWNS